ncbi:MAG TPA: glycosyltransferase family 2 protein [Kineosporiaceae bacterium]|nr:glycosyltransferase family 2 protein [Kineosporiaceae bacterium]
MASDLGTVQAPAVSRVLLPLDPTGSLRILSPDVKRADTEPRPTLDDVIHDRPARTLAQRLTPARITGVTSRRSARLNLEFSAWRPHLAPFFIPLVIILTLTVITYRTNRTPLGWILTVVWSLPIVGTLIGLQGAVLLRHSPRDRRQLTTPPPLVTAETLFVIVPTIGRHDTFPALARSVSSFVEYLPVAFQHLWVHILVEDGCEAMQQIRALADQHPQVRLVVVPRGYSTPNGTRFKARANHYAHQLRYSEGDARDDVWVLHMDDDTGIGPDTASALAHFVQRQATAGPDAKHLAQGILSYPRENAVNRFTWLADAVRPADDFARFRAATGSGTPVAGVHGELLMIRGSAEATIGWDFGPNSIVEDAHFALTFCSRYPGRSDWFNGRSYGASPATVHDLIRQRERWAWGLIALAMNRSIPLRYRFFLALSLMTWAIGPLQHLLVVLLIGWVVGMTNTSPVTESVLLLWSVNLAYVIWTYWEGLRLNVLSSQKRRRYWWEPIAVVSLIPIFALLEGLGGLRGLLKFLQRADKEFVVIAKPA